MNHLRIKPRGTRSPPPVEDQNPGQIAVLNETGYEFDIARRSIFEQTDSRFLRSAARHHSHLGILLVPLLALHLLNCLLNVLLSGLIILLGHNSRFDWWYLLVGVHHLQKTR